MLFADEKEVSTSDATVLTVDEIHDSNHANGGGKFQFGVSQQVVQWLMRLFDLWNNRMMVNDRLIQIGPPKWSFNHYSPLNANFRTQSNTPLAPENSWL